VPRELTTTEQEFLAKLAESPVAFMAQCSKDMGRCCYCNQPLSDPRSKRIGYGATCATRWMLPYGDPRYIDTVPSFAKLYNSTAAGLCEAIRTTPEDKDLWLILADWLEERGLSRCSPPKPGTVLPRNT
jgi:uncharacterized protein (TIGR02996 family)